MKTEVCLLDCFHGYCENKECVCHNGWTGPLCDMLACDPRCDSHGFCNNGTCICKTGWNGKHCTLGELYKYAQPFLINYCF